MQQSEAASYCMNMVRRGDRDLYLASLFARAATRDGLFALYALNLELARIADSVRQPMAGAIRQQWWRDGLEELARGSVRRHPVLEALEPWIGVLPPALLEAMIDSRSVELDDEPPATFADLLGYARDTGGAAARLAAHVLTGSAQVDSAVEAAAAEVGTAAALVAVLRALPARAGRGRVLLPRDLLEQHGVTPRAIVDGRAGPGLNQVVRLVAGEADRLLATARGGAGQVPRAVLPAVLPAAIADLYLRGLRQAGYDPLRAPTQYPSYGGQLRMLRKAALGRF